MKINNLAITSAAALLLGTAGLTAGEYHYGDLLRCQDCHLQHATEEGLPLPGGPFSTLLLKSTVNELCLSCHDGGDPSAPDVLDPVAMYDSELSGESAAGHLLLQGLDNPGGHTLGLPVPVPLQVEGEMLTLSCVSCHAPHGNRNYRNLVHDPGGRGDSLVVEDPGQVFTEFKPDVPPTTAATIAAYSRDNVAYGSGLETWCAGCHSELDANSAAIDPAHFNAHPSGVSLEEYPSDLHTDPDHWVLGSGEGFAPAADNSGIDRVPFAVPGATDIVSARLVARDNHVVCGSCHKSHGSDKQAALLWPYREGGPTFLAGCQQCHNQ